MPLGLIALCSLCPLCPLWWLAEVEAGVGLEGHDERITLVVTGLRDHDGRGALVTPAGVSYHANSAARRKTRGFMYANGVCQPVTFGMYVVL